jgi:hypothetical protein
LSTFSESPQPLAAHHTSKILDEVLEEPEWPADGQKGFKHPLYMDAIIATGLMLAMAGFTIGIIKIYITHTAKQYITQRHYKEAINLLSGAPLPGWFQVEGESPEELLNQAYYLDAMDKLELDNDDKSAIKELEKINPGSRFYEMTNDILKGHSPPSNITLEGAAEHQATPSEIRSEENTPIVPSTQNGDNR